VLLEDLHAARELGDRARLLAQLRGAELLVIDDLFLRRLPKAAGDELADVLMCRHKKASTIVTSNWPIDDWPAILDRVIHHGHLLKLDGRSWRTTHAAEQLARRNIDEQSSGCPVPSAGRL